MPFFSIVIPVYNVAPYLRECLDSVLAQTFGNWEAICVDDGSTDGSGAILDAYAAKDERIKVVHQPNRGVSAARNVALDMSRGEWIGFLDADDFWLKWMLQDIHECTEAHAVEWIRIEHRCVWHFKRGTEIAVDKKEAPIPCPAEDAMVSGWNLISRQAFPFLNFFKRQCVGRTRFAPNVRFREDALFCYEMATKTCKLSLVHMLGYCKRHREGGATLSPRHRDDTINLLTAYLNIWRKTRNHHVESLDAEAIVSASTFWVEKDVREWLFQCPDRTFSDAWKVTQLVINLRKEKAICGTLDHPDARRRQRWKLYLATGFWWIMVANRRNPLGRPIYSGNDRSPGKKDR